MLSNSCLLARDQTNQSTIFKYGSLFSCPSILAILTQPGTTASCGGLKLWKGDSTGQAKGRQRKVYNLTSLLSREPSLLTPRALVRHSLLLLLLLMAAKLLVKKTLSSGKKWRGKKKPWGCTSLHSGLFLPHNHQWNLLGDIVEALLWVSSSHAILMIQNDWDRTVTSLITSIKPSLSQFKHHREQEDQVWMFLSLLMTEWKGSSLPLRPHSHY